MCRGSLAGIQPEVTYYRDISKTEMVSVSPSQDEYGQDWPGQRLHLSLPEYAHHEGSPLERLRAVHRGE